IKGKRGEKLREAAPKLGLSKRLVTLQCDLPLDFELDSASVAKLRLERMGPILRELGFNRYQDELTQIIGGKAGGDAEGARSSANHAPALPAAGRGAGTRPCPPPPSHSASALRA